MTITELAIKRPIIIIVIFLGLTLLGIFSYNQLNYDLLPGLNFPMVSINTSYPGASASEVAASVTKPIEDAVSGLDKVDTITSTSQEGRSRVQIQFTPEANIDFALQDAQRKVNGIIRSLPSGIVTPALSKVSLDDRPVMSIGFTGSLPDTQFYQLVNDFLVPSISNIAGVGQVDINGGRQREIKVNLDTHKMQAYGISALGVLQAIKDANLEYPAGTVKDTDGQYIIRMAGRFKSLSELNNLIISQSPAGGKIRLSDVAEVQDGKKDITRFTRINGQNTISVGVLKQSDANTVIVSKLIKAELKKLERRYQKINLKSTIIFDNSTFITDSANAVKEDLLLAILLVAGVMLLFLHSIRNSMIVMVAIPTSLVVTFIGMWTFGFSLNIITLLALSLTIGILVDDAIVVLENIYRHLERGEDKRTAALQGRNEIGFTALSITLVDVVVYLPLTLIAGMIGGMLKQFSIVIVISTLTSLFVSFTVTPMLASRFGKLETFSRRTLIGRFGAWFERIYSTLTNDYIKALRICLVHPWKVLICAALLFTGALSLIFFGFIGSEFMPQADQDQLSVSVTLNTGAKIEETDVIVRNIERIIRQIPEVVTVYSTIGGSWGSTASYQASLNVMLVPKVKRSRSAGQISRMLRAQLRQIPGVKAYVSEPGIIPGSGGMAPIQVAVNGPNWDDVSQAATQISKLIARIPGTADVRLSTDNPQPERSILIDRDKMADLGLNMAAVGQTLQLSLTGNTDSKFLDRDGDQYDINVRLDQADRVHTSDIGNITIANRSGQLVALNQFATIVSSTGPTTLQRRNRSYSITVNAQAIGRTGGDIGNDIKKALGQTNFPAGVTTTFVGALKNQADSFLSLGLALLAAFVFVYLIMAALYNSFIYPLAVLFSAPMAVIGALLALGLTKNSLAVFSIMGIIMQVGLVSKNAILLVDFTSKGRAEGLSVHEALIQAGRERLRPILMTTLTMVFGMMPIALSKAASSEFKNSMGWALIGGLTCSMLMTLIVVPVVYTKIEQLRCRLLSIHDRVIKSEVGKPDF